MKTPLANKAALEIINSTCKPAMRHDDAHNATAALCAEIIARETAADDLLLALQAVIAWAIEKEEGDAYKAKLRKPEAFEKARRRFRGQCTCRPRETRQRNPDVPER